MSFSSFLIAAVSLFAVAAALLCCSPFAAYAQTDDAEIKISPDETSVYAAYDGHIAYTTKDGKLHLSTFAGSVSQNFSGTALDIAICENAVFLLTDTGETKKLISFDIEDGTLGKEQDVFEKFAVSDTLFSEFVNYMDAIAVSDGMLTVSALDADVYSWFCSIPFAAQASSSLSVNLDLGTIDSMTATSADQNGNYSIFAILSGNLYSFVYPASPISDQPIDETGKWLSVAALDDEIYAAAADGIYRVDGTTVVKISDEIADGDIRPYYEDDVPYLLVQSREENNVTQFSVSDDGLEYYSVFDNIVYAAPTEYDILTVAKAASDTQGFYSPKNLRPVASISAEDAVLVLAEASANDSSDEGYYFVRLDDSADGETCYVKKSDLTLLPRGEGWSHGKYAAALTSSVQVLQYPFLGSTVVATVGPRDALIVSGDVGTDGETAAEGWNWLKVSLMNSDGDVVDGYVDERVLGPYGPYNLPSFGKDAVVNADKLGEGVNVYSLPEERDDLIIGTLSDGDVVELAQDGINVDEEWTMINYRAEDGVEVAGYVKTACLSEGGLTTMQITLIVVACIIAAVTIVVVIIIAKKRKRERYE